MNGKIPEQIGRRKKYQMLLKMYNDSVHNTNILRKVVNRAYQLARVMAMELYVANPENEIFTEEGGVLTQEQIEETAKFVKNGEYNKIREGLKKWYSENKSNTEKNSQE